MANRKVMDAVNTETGEKVYFNSHAGATFMTDGRTLESVVEDIEEDLAKRNIYAVDQANIDNATAYVTVTDFNNILKSINSILDKINGETNE